MSRSVSGWAVLGVAALGLAGCAEAPPNQNAARLTALHPAQACTASLPTFGRFPGGRSFLDEIYLPPDARIAMANDGGWCTVRFTYAVRGEIPVVALLHVARPPAHGRAAVGSVGPSMRIAYRPVPGFAGTDAFTVHMAGPEPWNIPVYVTVIR
ncbi:MAG: hypothetical protein ACREFY_15645 [Acetobacteraceae bacterium]